MTMNVSRRSLLALGAGLGASTFLGGSALAKAPKLGTQTPYWHRFIVAPQIGVSVLGLSQRRNVPEDIEPGHAYDNARSLVADLSAFADARDVPRMRVSLPAPKHIFPTEVYALAGILLRQLEELERRLGP
jgi:hypothetical protein